MVKRSKSKAAPPTNRTGDEEAKRRATVEEADSKWERQEAARKLVEKKNAGISHGRDRGGIY